MNVTLKGIHKVKVKKQTYYYAWRGGPRVKAMPGTAEFIKLYNDALDTLKLKSSATMMTLIAQFKAGSEFTTKRDKTQKDYRRYLRKIEDKFGAMPKEAIEDPKARGEFKRWRDEMAMTPRSADYAITVLARVLSVALDNGEIAINRAEGIERLAKSDRSEFVWDDPALALLFSVCSPEIELAVILALWTGQRQADLINLPWSAYDGRTITLKQRKSKRRAKAKQSEADKEVAVGGKRVVIPVGATLKRYLDAAPRRSTLILTNARLGVPWTEDGFRSSFGKAFAKAKISDDLTFHDLRGTAVTRLALAGATVPEIAAITGHDMRDVEAILKRYLKREPELAENAMRKLEAHQSKRARRAKKMASASV